MNQKTPHAGTAFRWEASWAVTVMLKLQIAVVFGIGQIHGDLFPVSRPAVARLDLNAAAGGNLFSRFHFLGVGEESKMQLWRAGVMLNQECTLVWQREITAFSP